MGQTAAMTAKKNLWLAMAILVAFLGPLLVAGANRAIDAALVRPQAVSLPGALASTVCAPPLPAGLDAALAGLVPGPAPDEAVSRRMAELYQADQVVRAAPPADWARVEAGDRQRRIEVLDYLQAGQVGTTRDLVYAAFIFQHGNCSEHYLLAHQVAGLAVAAGDPEARWIYAATLDRYLQSLDQPQKYGTQYTLVDGRYQLYPVDPATTDAERQQYDVPPLAEAQARAETMRGSSVRAAPLLSWWLTLIGVAYALVGLAAAFALPRSARLARCTLWAALIVYLLSIGGHLLEVLAWSAARPVLWIVLGLAAAGLLGLAAAAIRQLGERKSAIGG